MAITVQIFGYLSLLLERKEIKLDWKGGTLGQMIDRLDAGHDQLVGKELLDEKGEIDRAYVILVNGDTVDDLLREIADGDEVVINSMLGGG